jgi:nitrate reductase NapD
MPIASFVVSTDGENGPKVEEEIKKLPGVEIYGSEFKKDENAYHIIIVIESETFDDMEKVERQIRYMDGVLNVALAYGYFEDEYEKIEKGEIIPTNPFHGLKRAEKEAEKMWFGDDEDEKKGH